MTFFDHQLWPAVSLYARATAFGKVIRLEFLQMPDDLRARALEAVANCASCGSVIHPLRARKKSGRARTAGSPSERRLFYAPTCPTEKNSGCSRARAAKEHRDVVRRMFALKVKDESRREVTLEVRDGAGAVLLRLAFGGERVSASLPAGAREVSVYEAALP